MQTIAPEWLTVSEVARILNLNPETIRRWAREDKIPFQRVGRIFVFRVKDVEKRATAN